MTGHCLDIGHGRPLVLLHGWAAHAGFFAPQATLAWSGLRVIAPDLPGMAATATARRQRSAIWPRRYTG